MIHKNYELLSKEEKYFVDRMFSRDLFTSAKMELGYSLLGNDEVEKAVEAFATWLVESAKEAHVMRFPLTVEGATPSRDEAFPLEWHLSFT